MPSFTRSHDFETSQRMMVEMGKNMEWSNKGARNRSLSNGSDTQFVDSRFGFFRCLEVTSTFAASVSFVSLRAIQKTQVATVARHRKH
ncbi:MAG TPA: hypothetical protein DD856_17645 [Sulfobacillus sp.]|nr:hypothetical protein [Sulfobacillus sp.]